MADIWDDAVGDWTVEDIAWNAVEETISLAVAVALALSVEVWSDQSDTYAVSVAYTPAAEATVDGSFTLATSNGLSQSVEAWAMPSDDDDNWQIAGNWDDAGGGQWDQSSGTPIRVNSGLVITGGLDSADSISLGVTMQRVVAPDDWQQATPSSWDALGDLWELPSQSMVDAEVQFGDGVSLGAIGAVSTTNTADVVESLTISESLGVSAPVEAWAAPNDVDDVWSTDASDWTTSGIWDDPGGTPLRVQVATISLAGQDAAETVTLGVTMQRLIIPDDWQQSEPAFWNALDDSWELPLQSMAEAQVDFADSSTVAVLVGITANGLGAEFSDQLELIVQGGALADVEAWAAPNDVEDAWSADASDWGTAGVWNDPGGTPMRVQADFQPSAGQDASEAISLGITLQRVVLADDWDQPLPPTWDDLGDSWQLPSQSMAEAEADFNSSTQFDSIQAVQSLSELGLIGDVVLAAAIVLDSQPNALDFSEELTFTTSLATISQEGRPQRWFPAAPIDDNWVPEPADDALWIPELEFSVFWQLSTSHLDAWIEGGDLSSLWIPETSSEKEWS